LEKIQILAFIKKNYSPLDVGFAQIDALKLTIGDSSAVMISGNSFKKK
jgi:hypothetical protein